MAAVALWDTVKDAITAYTGLSPATFFTVLAVAVAFYYAVSGFFQSPPPPRTMDRSFEEVEPLPPPVQLGEITEEDLRVYDGSDPKKPLLMAIKGQIYDVSQSRMFYGPGGPYALFAGKDASRALAKMSFEEKDLTGDISGLGPFELEALQDWEYKFMSKYVKVGTINKIVPVTDEPISNTSEIAEPIAKTTEGGPSDISGDHSAEPKEFDMSTSRIAEQKEVDMSTNPIAEQKEADKSLDHRAEPKGVDGSTDHVAEPKEVDGSTDHVAEPKEVDADEVAKE